MQFEFTLPHGFERRDLINLNQVAVKRRTFTRVFVPFLRIVLCLIGLFLFLSGLLLVIMDATVAVTTSIILMLIGILWFLLGAFYYRYGAWKSRKIALKDVGAITVMLDDEGIAEITEKGRASFPYNAICETVLFRSTYFLFLDKKHALILPVRCLSQGSPVAFEEFWQRKCEKRIKKL